MSVFHWHRRHLRFTNFRWLALAFLDLRSDPPPLLIFTFLVGIVIFGVTGNLFYSLFTETITGMGILRVLLGITVLIAIGWVSGRRYYRQTQSWLNISESSNVPKMSCVITTLSAYFESSTSDNLEPLRKLIKHHEPRLKELHLISVLSADDRGQVQVVNPRDPSNQGVVTAYEKLDGFLKTLATPPKVILHAIKNTDSAEDSFDVASALLENLSSQFPNDVVIDGTPGKKSMTIGLVTAAFAWGCPISYLATPRGPDGNPILGAQSEMVLLDSGQLRLQIMRRAVSVPDVDSRQTSGTS